MGPNSKIQINGGPNIGFVAINCCFKGSSSTTNYWNTIDVALGANATFRFCWIQDATYGITAHQQFSSTNPVSIINTTNTTFYKNSTGIYTPIYTGSITGDLKLSVTDCIFKGDPYSSTVPPNAVMGIQLSNLKFIDLSSYIPGTTNQFQDLRLAGIQINTSLKVTIRRCTFKNIDYLPYSSFGIIMDNSTGGTGFTGLFTQSGLGSGNTSAYSFYNVSSGILVAFAQANISRNHMQTGYSSISLNGCRNASNVIVDNRITSVSTYMNGATSGFAATGIIAMDCNPFGINSRIDQNHLNNFNISSTNGPGSGIYINNFTPNSGYGFNILGNYFNMQDAVHGVHTYQLCNSQFVNNFCDIVAHPSWLLLQDGIGVNFGKSNLLQCNTIISNTQSGYNIPGSSLYVPIGINSHGTSYSSFRCNELGDAGGLPTGMHFDQQSAGSEIYGNQFNYTGYGLVCGPNACALVPPGGFVSKGNQWNTAPPSSYYLARHFGSPFFVSASRFFINPTDIPTSLVPSSVYISPSNFFDYNISYTSGNSIPQACASSCDLYTPPPSIAPNLSFTEADFLEAQGYDSTSQYPETEEWLAAQTVFEILSTDSVLRYSDPDYLAFYNEMDNTPIDDFVNIENNINELSSYDSVVNHYYLIADSLGEEINILDSIYLDLESLNDSAGIAALYLVRDSLLGQLTMLMDSTNYLITSKYSDQSSAVSGILAEVESLPEEELFEWSTKTIYKILLTTTLVGNYTFTLEQQADIITIANFCPLQAGKAVLTARGLWQLFDQELPNFNDAVSCLMNGFLYKQSDMSSLKDAFLYPNPAHDIVNISLGEIGIKYSVSIHKAEGQLLYQTKILANSKETKIDISQLNAGLYILEVKSEKGDCKRSKLIKA